MVVRALPEETPLETVFAAMRKSPTKRVRVAGSKPDIQLAEGKGVYIVSKYHREISGSPATRHQQRRLMGPTDSQNAAHNDDNVGATQRVEGDTPPQSWC